MKPYTDSDLETDFRTALDAGDAERIERLAVEVDRRERHDIPSLLSSALWYAEQGLRVFPLSPGSKIPFKGSKGCLDATTDLAVVEGWWNSSPDANIGIATGHRVDVVDVDGPAGQASRAKNWDDIFAQIDADNIGKVLTPRPGGMHIYVPATGDGNSANIVPGVDYRGVGGYVVAPPSINEQGRYRWLGDLRLPVTEVAA